MVVVVTGVIPTPGIRLSESLKECSFAFLSRSGDPLTNYSQTNIVSLLVTNYPQATTLSTGEHISQSLLYGLGGLSAQGTKLKVKQALW